MTGTVTLKFEAEIIGFFIEFKGFDLGSLILSLSGLIGLRLAPVDVLVAPRVCAEAMGRPMSNELAQM